MKVLLDTNILARILEPGHSMYQNAIDATKSLSLQGHDLHIVPQNLYELWVVCTRPLAVNGLGKTAVEAASELANLKSLFALFEDGPALYPTWENLVVANGVLGKNAHDARLVSAMVIHGITHLLTFNDTDFRRFSNISVLTPAAVLGANPPPSP
jgi:predicted nucleic acid-binding protein